LKKLSRHIICAKRSAVKSTTSDYYYINYLRLLLPYVVRVRVRVKVRVRGRG